MVKTRSGKVTGSVSVKSVDEPKILDQDSSAQPLMDENVTGDVESVINPTQVNSKRKKRKKKSNCNTNVHDNNDSQICEGNQNKVENVESDLAKADKEPFLVNGNKLFVEPVVEKGETRKKKKRRTEDKNKGTNDVDMVDRAKTMPFTIHFEEDKDELKKTDVVAQVEEPKEGELKKKRLRKKKMKEKANDEHKLEQVVESDVDDKKKGVKENRLQENAIDKDIARVEDKTGIKPIGGLETGKGLFQRVKETIRLNASVCDDVTISNDGNIAPAKEEKKVIGKSKHQQAETKVCRITNEQNVEEKKDKPKEVNNKSEREDLRVDAINENEQPKKKRRKNKIKNLEAENGVQTEDQTVQDKEVNDKEQEKQGIVVIYESEQPKKKKRKGKSENINLEPNSENGVQIEDQTVQEKEVNDKLELEKQGIVVIYESEQPKKKKRKWKSENINLPSADNLLVASNLSVGKNLVVKRKLLVLDINGLLADVVYPAPKNCTPDKITAGRAMFMRPFYIDFLNFCFERFDVGIWSSRTKNILDQVVECLLGKLKHKLLFCWDQSHCTPTKGGTLENKFKPLLFKELRKLWEKKDPNLPWEMGFYNQSNTLLIDDSPYKALLNPKNTAIFPRSFTYKLKQDSSLAPGGDIRVYLEKVAEAPNMQKYVEQNLFGQVGIDEKHESWSFYSKFEKLRYVESPITTQK